MHVMFTYIMLLAVKYWFLLCTKFVDDYEKVRALLIGRRTVAAHKMRKTGERGAKFLG